MTFINFMSSNDFFQTDKDKRVVALRHNKVVSSKNFDYKLFLPGKRQDQVQQKFDLFDLNPIKLY